MYRTRQKSAEFLAEKLGAEITAQALADRAHNGSGPRYAIINGRAVYREEDLLAWLAEQAARPVIRRSQRKANSSAPIPKTQPQPPFDERI